MFYYFNGEVTLLESNLAVIDCGGVGYACRTSSYTLSRLHVGERARLYTYCSIREDAFDIYGFSTREAALAELGYRPQEITAALRSFDPEGMKTEEIVRQCLRAMVMR